jgi:hypothetical protein
MRRILWLWGVAGVLSQSGSAQVANSTSATLDSSGAVQYRASIVLRLPAAAGPPVGGAPFSAEEIVNSYSLTADGRRMDQPESRRKLYRDSAGRTRAERRLALVPNASDPPLLVEITDVVDGYYYALDLDRRVAHRMAMPRPNGAPQANDEPPVAVAPERSRQPAGPTPFMEKLGKKPIEGVSVEGVRRTLYLPDDSNKGRRYTVGEVWRSPELGIVVLEELTDSLHGTRTTRLRNISQSEPDGALFRVPPGFTIQDHEREIQVEFNFR